MRYKIMQNGEVVNQIVAAESFVSQYCAKNGYTYEEDPLPVGAFEPVEVTPEETPVEKLQKENTLLKAQVQAQSDRTDFLEDCMAEMAGMVYA